MGSLIVQIMESAILALIPPALTRPSGRIMPINESLNGKFVTVLENEAVVIPFLLSGNRAVFVQGDRAKLPVMYTRQD